MQLALGSHDYVELEIFCALKVEVASCLHQGFCILA